jgi:hypothetical protein
MHRHAFLPFRCAAAKKMTEEAKYSMHGTTFQYNMSQHSTPSCNAVQHRELLDGRADCSPKLCKTEHVANFDVSALQHDATCCSTAKTWYNMLHHSTTSYQVLLSKMTEDRRLQKYTRVPACPSSHLYNPSWRDYRSGSKTTNVLMYQVSLPISASVLAHALRQLPLADCLSAQHTGIRRLSSATVTGYAQRGQAAQQWCDSWDA